MKQFILGAIFLFSTSIFFAQTTPQAYTDLVRQAETLYQAKTYTAAAQTYSAAFKAGDWKAYPRDRYNAACAWALAGVPDSAFFQLYKIAAGSKYTRAFITLDPDLNTLHNDARWQPLLNLIQNNKAESGYLIVNYNNPQGIQLDSIFVEDQLYRLQSGEIEQKYGLKSTEMRDHLKKIDQKDSINLIKVRSILDQYGWLGPDIVGEQGATTLFLVIQHADLSTQEKYMPMLREAVKAGKARGSDIAFLEDRIALRQGKRQVYGTQIGRDPETMLFFVSPLNDPDQVDTRRAEIGLQPLADYVTRWQIQWNPEQYKKDLPQIEERLKRK